MSAYHPQTHRLTERNNRTIKERLSKEVDKNPETWPDHLDTVISSINTQKQNTIKTSPYELLHGMQYY